MGAGLSPAVNRVCFAHVFALFAPAVGCRSDTLGCGCCNCSLGCRSSQLLDASASPAVQSARATRYSRYSANSCSTPYDDARERFRTSVQKRKWVSVLTMTQVAALVRTW